MKTASVTIKPLPLIWLALFISMVACSPKPEPINYGHDGCHFCKMTIVDPRYGTELVTDKGKVYKFDAIECLINFKSENSDLEFAFTLVSTLDQQQLINAEEAFYLRSAQLPSPMGMYITAFSATQARNEMHENVSGEMFDWDELVTAFNHLPEINESKNGE